MTQLIRSLLVGACALSPFLARAAEEAPAAPAAPVATAVAAPEAVVPGVWTENYAEALKVAKAKRLPLFLSFTGSDWCGWCQVMEKDCLTKPEFLKAMSTEYVLVSVDFPHKTKLTAEHMAQNSALASRFKGKGGFPSYVVVDSTDESVKWGFGAHPKYRKKTVGVELMVKDLHEFAAGCANVIERNAEGLPAEKAAAYREKAAAFVKRQAEVKAWLDKASAAKSSREQVKLEIAQLAKYREELAGLVAAMDELRK